MHLCFCGLHTVLFKVIEIGSFFYSLTLVYLAKEIIFNRSIVQTTSYTALLRQKQCFKENVSGYCQNKTKYKFVVADTTPRKRASVTVYANIPNLTKKILHKCLGMSRAIVCWVIAQVNATGSVTPKEKENVTEKGFSFLGFRKRFPFLEKTSFAFPQNSKLIPSEGKPFSFKKFSKNCKLSKVCGVIYKLRHYVPFSTLK